MPGPGLPKFFHILKFLGQKEQTILQCARYLRLVGNFCRPSLRCHRKTIKCVLPTSYISGERDQGAVHEQGLQARPDRRVHRGVRGAQRLVRQPDQDQDHFRRLEVLSIVEPILEFRATIQGSPSAFSLGFVEFKLHSMRCFVN